MTTLNYTLPSLPALPVPRPSCHTQATRWLNQRHDKALEVAANILTLADQVKDQGDLAACGELIAEAKAYLAEAASIAAMRKK